MFGLDPTLALKVTTTALRTVLSFIASKGGRAKLILRYLKFVGTLDADLTLGRGYVAIILM
jgi:hypothetical protein